MSADRQTEISFSGKVKEELAKNISEPRHCRIAEISAFLGMCGKIHIDTREQYSICIHTENISVARKYFTLLEKTFNIVTDVRVSFHAARKNISYTVIVRRHEDALRILQATRLLDDAQVSDTVVQQSCCKRAWLRGVFLASGSMSNPEKAYHLEIVCTAKELAKKTKRLIDSFGLEAKIIIRKKTYVVYLKEGAQIVDLLNVMEAPISLMEFENVRILKEISNSVNRQVNCETANINKTVSAAVKQIEDITYIREHIGLQKLPDNLREIAALRLEYPQASLKELGELLEEPVGKSGVNHRLRKLSNIAEDLREKQEDQRND